MSLRCTFTVQNIYLINIILAASGLNIIYVTIIGQKAKHTTFMHNARIFNVYKFINEYHHNSIGIITSI